MSLPLFRSVKPSDGWTLRSELLFVTFKRLGAPGFLRTGLFGLALRSGSLAATSSTTALRLNRKSISKVTISSDRCSCQSHHSSSTFCSPDSSSIFPAENHYFKSPGPSRIISTPPSPPIPGHLTVVLLQPLINKVFSHSKNYLVRFTKLNINESGTDPSQVLTRHKPCEIVDAVSSSGIPSAKLKSGSEISCIPLSDRSMITTRCTLGTLNSSAVSRTASMLVSFVSALKIHRSFIGAIVHISPPHMWAAHHSTPSNHPSRILYAEKAVFRNPLYGKIPISQHRK